MFQVKCDDMCIMYVDGTRVLEQCSYSNNTYMDMGNVVSVTEGESYTFELYMRDYISGEQMLWNYLPFYGNMSTYAQWPQSYDFVPRGETCSSSPAGWNETFALPDAFVFTNCGQTDVRTGPTLSLCKSHYGTSSYPWLEQPSLYDVTGASGVNGIQVWTVPRTGTYYFYAYGAAGGKDTDANEGGNGAFVMRVIQLSTADKLIILIGQKGTDHGEGGGGGGGTFVYNFTGTNWYDINNEILLAAGGGGGGGKNTAGDPGQANEDGTSGVGSGGAGGNNGGKV